MPTISMCSASQPSLLRLVARRCAARGTSCRAARCRRSRSRSDLIVSSSGKCMMKRRSGSSSPIECRPRTNVPSRSMRASAGAPMRVMMRMLATTYGRVGDLDAATRQRRIDRAHAVRDHVHGAAAHAAGEQRVHLRVAVGRRHPVVVRAGVVLLAACRRRSGARRARRRPDASGAASSSGWVCSD